MDAPTFRPAGAEGLLVGFGEEIDEAVNARVVALDRALARAAPPGLVETVPAFCALLLLFDPLVTDHAALEAAVRARLDETDEAPEAFAEHVVRVCYDPIFAPDLHVAAAALALSPRELAARHLAGRYRVYMYGFAPGYAYLGGLPEALRLPRKPRAQPGVPAGSVLIAGGQCLVSTLTMPSGWWIVGRSPDRVFDPAAPDPFLFRPGDRVRFQAVSAAEAGAP